MEAGNSRHRQLPSWTGERNIRIQGKRRSYCRADNVSHLREPSTHAIIARSLGGQFMFYLGKWGCPMKWPCACRTAGSLFSFLLSFSEVYDFKSISLSWWAFSQNHSYLRTCNGPWMFSLINSLLDLPWSFLRTLSLPLPSCLQAPF